MEPFVVSGGEEGQPVLFHIQDWEARIPGLTAGFSSRRGGVGEGSFDSLNCALHVADRPEHVELNRRRIAGAVGTTFEAWTCAEQVHSAEVAVVTLKDRGRGRLSRADAFADTDGLITRERGIWLNAFFADCVPLFFVDPVTRSIGLAHAGWRGTVQRIAGKTVERMQEAFGAKPETIRAAIGPSIGECCYEVDEAVIREVQAGLPDVTEGWTRRENGKFMLDLKQINTQILSKAGILPEHIEITQWCTSCNTDWFFSHRKESGRTGRMTAWIGLDLF
ncbi:peptidoglycan editing factor PgeF [Paenibacillus sp. y28]|uniref:peptidoglycan editing factor PgeF n=1 Tax=Paenibacillus sp. y28 TaxID=3129110 RepID=UPI003018A01C